VKKPVKGAKGLVKSLGKVFLGLVGRAASDVAELTSTSLKLIKRFDLFISNEINCIFKSKIRVATDEQIVHRIRNRRHVGRDGLVRPSIDHETLANFIFDARRFSFSKQISLFDLFLFFRNLVKNNIQNMKVILPILIHQ